MSVSINQGTQSAIATDTIGTVNYQIIKLDRGAAGLSNLFTGTIDAVTALGTLKGGTVDAVSQLPPNSWGTTINTGTSTLGTIKPLVAGSQIFVTDITISVGSASNVTIGNGGTSTPMIGTLFFNANAGVVENFRVPISTSAGSALVYIQSSNGPMTITASGFVR